MSLIYFEDMIHYYHTPTLEDTMIEVGDMILYQHRQGNHSEDNDIGWVTHTEAHHKNGGFAYLIYIKWLSNGDDDAMWDHDLYGSDGTFKIVKGGQHER